jgi:hypothetical protein
MIHMNSDARACACAFETPEVLMPMKGVFPKAQGYAGFGGTRKRF